MNIRLGLFDSGVGGFTVLRRVIERHGDLNCVFLGDLARVPYGTKSSSEIRQIAREVIEWLNQQELSAVLIACNTTNSLALDIVKDFSKVPVFGLIDAAAEMVSKKKVGVLATPATVDSKAYSNHILSLSPDRLVVEQACPAFVPMIETGQFNTNEIRKVACKYLEPLIEARVEEVILGCSHYPLLSSLLRELLPLNVKLLDPAVRMAKNLDKFIGNNKFSSREQVNFSNTRFCVTDDVDGFATRTKFWLKIYPDVEHISLQSKAKVF